MALTAAAHWIASQGGTLAVGKGEQFWKPAFGDLLAHVASQHIEMIGRRGAGNESVPTVLFASIRVLYPYSDPDHRLLETMFGEEPVLDCSPFTEDEEQWQETNDRLYASGRDDDPQWTHLQVKKSDVTRFWPTRRRESGVVEPTTSTPVTAPAPQRAKQKLKPEARERERVKAVMRKGVEEGKWTVKALRRNKLAWAKEFKTGQTTAYEAALELEGEELAKRK
jgi:hypothetical protein